MKTSRKTMLAVFCALAGGAAALFLIWQSAVNGVSGPGDLTGGCWFSRWLVSWLSSRLSWLPAVWLAVFFCGLWFFCRQLVDFFGGGDWRNTAMIFGILAVLLPPARDFFAGHTGAVTVTIPACFGLGGLSSLLRSYTDREHAWLHCIAGLVLIVPGCGGSLPPAMILVALLATLNFAVALNRQSIVKSQIALTLSVAAAAVNVFLCL